MPARDKTGPRGQGPFTGQRGGNPPPRRGQGSGSGFGPLSFGGFGRGFGRGFGFGRGMGFCPFWNTFWPFSKKPTKKDLEDQKEQLKQIHQDELAQIDEFIAQSE